MKLGFTGTRTGMTKAQREVFAEVIRLLKATEFHHGDCVGADEQAALDAYGSGVHVVCHPPKDSTHRAFGAFHERREEKTHFARNRDIVNETEHLVATPWQAKRPPARTGGGTWYTIEYAEKVGKPVTIIWPDGFTASSLLR